VLLSIFDVTTSATLVPDSAYFHVVDRCRQHHNQSERSDAGVVSGTFTDLCQLAKGEVLIYLHLIFERARTFTEQEH
jgi:hypothetical protein